MDDEALRKLMLEVAKKDLGEDEKIREESIKQFKHWIETNPDVRNYNGDEDFVLSYLRKGKFSIQRAQEVFLMCETYKSKNSFMQNIDIFDPKINVLARSGHVFVSPITDDKGCHTILFQMSNFDPKKSDFNDVVRIHVASCYTMIHKMYPTVLGVTFVVNMANLTAAHVTHMPLSVLIGLIKELQHAIPIKFKGFHVINTPAPLKWFFDILMPHASEKMRKRFMVHGSLEELHKHLSPNTLPMEYGGTMPCQEMIDWWYQEMVKAQPSLTEWYQIHLVQSDLQTSLDQLPGSFRKLEVD